MSLFQIQSELKAPKNQFNKFGGYKYRSCEDIMEALNNVAKKKVLPNLKIDKESKEYITKLSNGDLRYAYNSWIN